MPSKSITKKKTKNNNNSNNNNNFQRSSYSPFKNVETATATATECSANFNTNDNKNQQSPTTTTSGIKNNNHHHHHHHHHRRINNYVDHHHHHLIGGPDSDDLIPTESLLKDSQYQSVLNAGEDDEIFITGYKRSILRTIICWLFIGLTFGLLRLILHWWRHWYLIATHSKCPLNVAEKMLIREDYQGKHQLYYVKDVITLNYQNLIKMIETKSKSAELFPIDEQIEPNNFYLSVHFSSGHFRHTDEIRLFRCKQLRYIWNNDIQAYQKLQGLDCNILSAYLHQRTGLTTLEQNARRLVYGFNEITIPIKGVITLLFLEALNPFYVFQIFSVCLWISYNYYYYAAVIVLMSCFGIFMSILQTKKNQDALRSTVQNSDCAIVILENGNVQSTVTNNLVPGDLIEIPSSGCLLHYDAVLLSGNCILDESILTGESVPVTKTPLPIKRDLIYDKKEHSRHTLFCGTKVMQTRYIFGEKVLALIINTGNITAKGGLIRSILYPPPVDYKFEQDSYKFIGLLGLVAGIGFVYTLVSKILRSVSAAKIAIESLDLITIAVPPALPAAMTVGRYYAQKRLENKDIYCISPRSINVSGSIDCVCFDKTGTLTEDGLDMWGVVPRSTTNQFQIPFKQIQRLPNDHLLYGMVSCHSITIMNGIMKGDPLDLKMFESTGWILEDANVADDNKYDLIFPTIVRRPKPIIDATNHETNATNLMQKQQSDDDLTNLQQIGIVKEFPFTSNLQRMSVITRLLSDNHYNVYCKGSPEMIQTLCRSTTIPTNYLNQLDVYAQQGYRIIAIAYKELNKKITYSRAQRLSRDKIECELEFQGFVILENRLKPDTTDVIKNLTKANIRTVMVTGDNMLTALSVAKDCGMIAKKQCVITINVRHNLNEFGKNELYYNLIGSCGGSGSSGDGRGANANVNGDGPSAYKHKNDDDDDDDDDLQTITTMTTIDNTTNPSTIIELNNSNCNNGDIYSIMTNCNSIDSLETVAVDTWQNRDVECGYNLSTIVAEAATTTTTTTNSCKPPRKKFIRLPNLLINRNRNRNHNNNNNNNNNNNKKKNHNHFYNNNYNNDDYDDDDNDNDNDNDNKKCHFNNNYRFAMIGKTWSIIREQYPDLLSNFVTRGTIFARMSPDQKQSLILELQDLGYYVAMCGDGANDCGALKAAHTGISLSEAESSVASPFTSKKPTIQCVPNVIKEGRAALVTSFGIFKYMAAYSLVQFASVLILYSIDSNLTDLQFLYIDLGLISIFAFYFGKTEAYDGPLVKLPPLNSLIALSPIISLFLHLTVSICIQLIGWYHLKSELWYKPFNINLAKNDYDLACTENYVIFIISCYQYIILAFVFSKGKPYRKTILSNLPFLFTIIINLLIVIYFTISPSQFFITNFEFELPPSINYRLLLLLYGIINFIISLFIELFIIEYIIFNKFNKNKKNCNQKYRQIEIELNANLKWPPLSSINDYNNDDIVNNVNKNDNNDCNNMINNKSSPISYAEISAEHSIDLLTPNDSVLNNFFDINAINQKTKPQQQQQPQPQQDQQTTNEDQLKMNKKIENYDEDEDNELSSSEYESANNILIQSQSDNDNKSIEDDDDDDDDDDDEIFHLTNDQILNHQQSTTNDPNEKIQFNNFEMQSNRIEFNQQQQQSINYVTTTNLIDNNQFNNDLNVNIEISKNYCKKSNDIDLNDKLS